MNSKITLAIAATLLPALAFAADPVVIKASKAAVPTVVVTYSDIDLSTQKGVHALRARLNNAAWQVCRDVVTRPVSIEGSLCRLQLVQAAEHDVPALR